MSEKKAAKLTLDRVAEFMRRETGWRVEEVDGQIQMAPPKEPEDRKVTSAPPKVEGDWQEAALVRLPGGDAVMVRVELAPGADMRVVWSDPDGNWNDEDWVSLTDTGRTMGDWVRDLEEVEEPEIFKAVLQGTAKCLDSLTGSDGPAALQEELGTAGTALVARLMLESHKEALHTETVLVGGRPVKLVFNAKDGPDMAVMAKQISQQLGVEAQVVSAGTVGLAYVTDDMTMEEQEEEMNRKVIGLPMQAGICRILDLRWLPPTRTLRASQRVSQALETAPSVEASPQPVPGEEDPWSVVTRKVEDPETNLKVEVRMTRGLGLKIRCSGLLCGEGEVLETTVHTLLQDFEAARQNVLLGVGGEGFQGTQCLTVMARLTAKALAVMAISDLQGYQRARAGAVAVMFLAKVKGWVREDAERRAAQAELGL